ncbi:MAG: hypothetical protein ABIE23_04085 [archaeon]
MKKNKVLWIFSFIVLICGLFVIWQLTKTKGIGDLCITSEDCENIQCPPTERYLMSYHSAQYSTEQFPVCDYVCKCVPGGTYY